MKYTTIFILTFFAFSTVQAVTADSLPSKTNNKTSIEFAGGITYCNYTFKKKYDYFSDNISYPDSMKNSIGKSLALNVYFPIKKSNVYFVSGLGFIQRNTSLLVDEARYQTQEPIALKQNISYSFISLSLGFGYKILEIKRYVLDANLMLMPGYSIYNRTEVFYTKNKSKQVFVNSWESSPMFFKKIIAPIYLNINNRFHISKQLSMGLNIGFFYDPIRPFPNNIIKNKLNYSSQLILKYTF